MLSANGTDSSGCFAPLTPRYIASSNVASYRIQIQTQCKSTRPKLLLYEIAHAMMTLSRMAGSTGAVCRYNIM